MVVEYCGGGCCWYSDVGAKERVVVVFVVDVALWSMDDGLVRRHDSYWNHW